MHNNWVSPNVITAICKNTKDKDKKLSNTATSFRPILCTAFSNKRKTNRKIKVNNSTKNMKKTSFQEVEVPSRSTSLHHIIISDEK